MLWARLKYISMRAGAFLILLLSALVMGFHGAGVHMSASR